MAAYQNKKWIESPSKFINPYNFIPFGKDVIRNESQSGSLSGKITCQITSVTPLAVPDSERKRVSKAVADHYEYPFFTSPDGKHIIPGSSIRGVVRSMFEALTNSCFSVNNNNILSMRHTFQRNPGILIHENGSWHLYNAKKKKISGVTEINSNQVIRKWYDIERNVHTYFLFTKESKVSCFELDKAVEDYKECIDIYRKNAEKAGEKELALFNGSTTKLDKQGMNPVFFEIVKKKTEEGLVNTVYLSPAQMSRSVFHNKLNDLLGGHKACKLNEKGDNTLCEGCALFGTLRDNGKAYASRVRFTDAKEIIFKSLGMKTLKELASPKTTAVEFYTNRPQDSKAWNYDYKTISYDKVKQNGRSVYIPKRENTEIKIRGRKLYLHSLEADYTTAECTKRNSTMELADMGSSFEFDVFFNRITEEQLSKLVWVLALGDNKEDSTKCYKIGHGKPLGLGSAKITVKGINIREYDSDKKTYSIISSNTDEYISKCELTANKNVERLIDTETTKGKIVSYPIAEDKTTKGVNSKAAHQWFAANRSINGTGTAWDYNLTLPRMTDKSIELPAYERKIADDNQPPAKQSFGENMFGSIQIKIRGTRNKKK